MTDQISNFQDITYLSVLRGTTDVPSLEVGDLELAALLDAIDTPVTLQGLHLGNWIFWAKKIDLKNTRVTTVGVQKLTSFLGNCNHLVTLGIDLAK